MDRINLKKAGLKELETILSGIGQKPYRAKQLIHWIYERGEADIESITVFSKDLRAELAEKAYIGSLELLERKVSKDGTEKYIFGLEDGEAIESVLIPDEDRLTLCISSQAGCAMGCAFCLTGAQGFRRNLEPFEILDQALCASRLAGRRVTNIVIMGMGEPLMNFDNVCEALRRLTDWAGFSKRRITLSTCGVVPNIKRLPECAPAVNLAVSLNATTDEVRDRIMPVNKKYPLKTLMEALRQYPLEPGRKITFEYVMLAGVNDAPEDARRLVKLLHAIPSKVNLIPFNGYPGAPFKAPSDNAVAGFQERLTKSNITAIIRKSRGSDILAACGQLRGKALGELYGPALTRRPI